jgi:thiol:disulfide interchange protein DsbD
MKSNWLLWGLVLFCSALSGTVFAGEAIESPAQGSLDISEFLVAISLAFGGGIILNVMPCVFPVLSIKILGFVQHANQSRSHRINHALVYTLGILISFWVLTIVQLIVGEAVNPGRALQEPVMLIILIFFLTLFALNLFGVFEIGTSLTTVGSDAIHKSGLKGSFNSGLLATTLGAPCVGPGLGGALGYTIDKPAWVTIAVFTAMGIGLAFPFILLSLVPSLSKYLPKPGRWMESFKQFMGFPLLATSVWLLSILAGFVTGSDTLLFMMTLTIVSMAAWVYGRWSVPGNSERARWISRIISLLIIIGSLGYWTMNADDKAELAKIKKEDEKATIIDKALRENAAASSSNNALCSTPLIQEKREAAKERGEIFWEEWSPDYAQQLLAKGCPVYIDFTAEWCVSCIANKNNTFSSKDVVDRFYELGIITLKADWTDEGEVIKSELTKYKRTGVPLNLLFNAKTESEEPLIMPAIFAAGGMMEALDEKFK